MIEQGRGEHLTRRQEDALSGPQGKVVLGGGFEGKWCLKKRALWTSVRLRGKRQ